MRADEVRGWGCLAGEVVAQGAGHVQQVHRGLAGRVFGLVERAVPVARPVRIAHDLIATTVYTGTRHGGRLAVRLGAGVVSTAVPPDAPAGFVSPVAATFHSGVVGLIGDRLAAVANPIAGTVRLRADGDDVPLLPGAVRAAWPQPTGRLLVQLTGLCENEHAWRYRAARWWDDPTASHGARLHAQHGWTPVDVAYSSGLPLADSGADLSHLLRRLLDAWPEPVEEIAILGHSMGGLVARHAIHRGAERGDAWVQSCSRLVCLGTPHGGAPLARGVARLAAVLRRLPETTGIGDVLELRSAGIRDLEHPVAVPDVPGVEVHLVAAVLPGLPGRMASEVVGDLLVGHESAVGRTSDGQQIAAATVRTFPGLTHFDLLNHPTVSDHLVTILEPRPRHRGREHRLRPGA